MLHAIRNILISKHALLPVVILVLVGMTQSCVSDRDTCEWSYDSVSSNRGKATFFLADHLQCLNEAEQGIGSADSCDGSLMMFLLFETDARKCESESDIPIWPKIVRTAPSIIKANRHYGPADGLSRIGIRQSVAIPEHEKHLIAFDDAVHKPEAIVFHELAGSRL